MYFNYLTSQAEAEFQFIETRLRANELTRQDLAHSYSLIQSNDIVADKGFPDTKGGYDIQEDGNYGVTNSYGDIGEKVALNEVGWEAEEVERKLFEYTMQAKLQESQRGMELLMAQQLHEDEVVAAEVEAKVSYLNDVIPYFTSVYTP